MNRPPRHQLDEATAIEVGRQLCELSAHVQAAQAELALRLADFDDGTGWGGAGIRSCPTGCRSTPASTSPPPPTSSASATRSPTSP